MSALLGIRPQYKHLMPRLIKIRQTMPCLGPDQVMSTMKFLCAAAGEGLFTNPGEIGTLLVGFKPAVSFSLPDSASVLHGVEAHLYCLGFKYSSRAEILRVPGKSLLPIRDGLIWSTATACELYGGTEEKLSRQIADLLTPEQVKKLPGYLLGYADDTYDRNAYLVDVRLHFNQDAPNRYFRVHSSRAKNPQDAHELTQYYQTAAQQFADRLGLKASVTFKTF
jgi:hypothetical protein